MHEPYPHPHRTSNSASIAAWILIIFACALALVPVLGFAVWLISGPILLVTLILGIIAVSNGRAANGVMIILVSIIFAPGFILLAPIVSTGIAIGAASSAESALSETSDTAASIDSSHLSAQQNPGYSPIVEQIVPDATKEENQDSIPAIRHPVPARTATMETPASPLPESAEHFTGFPYTARIVDPLGRDSIVLQSKSSMLGKNLGRVTVGTLVHASNFDGDWISVRLDDGQVGYVRRKQLLFPGE